MLPFDIARCEGVIIQREGNRICLRRDDCKRHIAARTPANRPLPYMAAMDKCDAFIGAKK
jgi:hypothetical protein